MASPSAWTAKAHGVTMSLSSGFGARSNTRREISGTTTRCPRQGLPSADPSASTIAKDHIRALTGRRPIRPISPRCRMSRRLNPGRSSTYQTEEAVQTSGASSDLTYVTAYPKHAFLIDMLAYYGFRETMKIDSGEIVLEKPIATGAFPGATGSVFDFDRAHYPRFYDGHVVRKFCVPIQPDYHRRLFPEIAFGRDLPLFPKEEFGLILAHGQERTPGNTIRKVYLCRAKTTRLRPGDLLLFYMSKDDRYAASQSITTVGDVEQVIDVTTVDDLIRHTAKRSVFSADDLSGMNPSVNSAVKTIDFLLAGHIEPPVRLDALIRDGVFSSRPPQSIAELTEERYVRLKPLIQLGYKL